MSHEFGKPKDPIGEGVAPKAKNLILLGIKERYYCPRRLACTHTMLDEKPGATSIS